MRRVSRSSTLLVAVATLAPTILVGAQAADPPLDRWLLPLRTRVPPGVEVDLDLSGGDAFPDGGAAVAPGDVVAAAVRLGGRREALPEGRLRGRALRFRVPMRRPGIATVRVELAARTRALDSAAVRHYLQAVGAPDSVWRAYLVEPYPRRWRERSAAQATTFVRVASGARPLPAADASWRAAWHAAARAGDGGGGEPPSDTPPPTLELLPEADPTGVRAGDTLVVRALRRGVAVAGLTVTLAGGDGGTRVRKALLPGSGARRTDAEGRVRLVLPSPGRWLLRATDLRRPTRDPARDAALDWASEVATVTLSVR